MRVRGRGKRQQPHERGQGEGGRDPGPVPVTGRGPGSAPQRAGPRLPQRHARDRSRGKRRPLSGHDRARAVRSWRLRTCLTKRRGHALANAAGRVPAFTPPLAAERSRAPLGVARIAADMVGNLGRQSACCCRAGTGDLRGRRTLGRARAHEARRRPFPGSVCCSCPGQPRAAIGLCCDPWCPAVEARQASGSPRAAGSGLTLGMLACGDRRPDCAHFYARRQTARGVAEPGGSPAGSPRP